MPVSKNRRSSNSVNFLEDQGLTILTKKDVGVNGKKPPKIRGKHFTNLEYLAEADLVWLTPDKSKSFPSLLYNKSTDSSYFEQCFLPLNRLGEGSFGAVFRVINKNDMTYYAVKISKEPFRNDKDRALKLNEVNQHKRFSDHPNIVTLHEAWEEDRQLFMQMELCKKSLVMSEPMAEKQCWEVLADIASALAYIHDLGVGHFDVKLENIQLGYDGLYKLSDFGLVYHFKEDRKRMPQEGDAKYLAPELLSSKSSDITSKVDIFSLGIAVMELAGNLSLPSNGQIWKALRENTFPFAQTSHISDKLFFLLARMMSPNPSDRPTAREIQSIPSVKAILKKRKRLIGSGSLCVSMTTFELLPYMAVWAFFGALLYLVAKLVRKSKHLPSTVLNEADDNIPTCSTSDNLTNNGDSFGKLPTTDYFNHGNSFTTSTPFQPLYLKKHALSISSRIHNESDSPTYSEESDESRQSQMPNDHVFVIPRCRNSMSQSCQSCELSHIKSPLGHLSLPGPSVSALDNNLCLTSPSVFRLGLSPVHISSEIKAVVKAKKRRRLMTPRNLSQSFDNDVDT